MIQNHLTSQPLSKRLKELGVPQKSCFAWKPFYSITNDTSIDWQGTFTIKDNQNTLSNGQDVFKPWYPKMRELEELNTSAFLSSELGEIMKKTSLEIHRFELADGTVVYRAGSNSETEAPTMAESMGLMLEYLILNGLIKI